MSMGTNAAESPSNNRSPRGGGGGGGDGANSPLSRRIGSNTAATARNLSSPWANVVRSGGGGGGGSVEREVVASTASAAAAVAPPSTSLPSVAEVPPPDRALESDPTPGKALPPGNAVAEAALESPGNDSNGSGNAAKAAKKPAWNKPSNGVVDAGPVMGAAWPALSESARVSAKSSDSLRAPSDGLTPVSTSTGPASPLHKPTTSNSTPNNVFPARHKSSKRGAGMGPINNGGFVPQQPAETPLSAADKPVAAAAAAEAPPDSSPRDPPHKNNNWEAGPRSPANQQSHVGTEPPRGVFRRGNGGPRGGGDGHYHGGYGNRRDHERTNYEWRGRELHVRQPRVLPRNFIRPPAPATAPPPFVAPPPIRPYGGPMGFPDLPAPQYYIPVPPPESVRSGPFVAHPGPPSPMFYTPAAQLQTMLIKQIDYYFR